MPEPIFELNGYVSSSLFLRCLADAVSVVHPNWTYGNVETIINRRFKGHLNGVTDETLAQTIVLEPRFGTAPYWIESYRTRSIGSISQTLYAIVLIPRVHYTLGVVRTEASDYPIPICARISYSWLPMVNLSLS